MEVRLYSNSLRPGIGWRPRRESLRPLLPQHARHCPVLEAGSATGLLVYPPLEENESFHIEYQGDGRYQFVYLLNRLASIPEGERTLLDNSLIMFGSSISDGNAHNPANLPILLGGKGGGRVQPGRHLAGGRNTPLCNLYVSMLDCLGIQVPRFGDSTEALRGLLR